MSRAICTWHRRSAAVRVLLVMWPLALAGGAIVRQTHPFRVVSDDHTFYAIAVDAAQRARFGMQSGGAWRAVREFAAANILREPLPPHISRKRPLLPWVWSFAVLLGGDEGLVWTWRALYLLAVIALLVQLTRTSSLPVASFVTGVVAVAPASQGLLSWMSCATFLVSYPCALFGMAAVMGSRRMPRVLGGALLLALALLSREVMFLAIPAAGALYAVLSRRRWLALVLPLLTIAVWFALPAEDRSGTAALLADPALFLRSALAVTAAESACIVRNLGTPLLLASLAAVWPLHPLLLVPVAAAALASAPLQLLLPVGLMLVAVARTKRALPGLGWVGMTVAAIILYGYFTSRYAFEPLVGMALALAPALMTVTRGRRLLVLLPFVVWHAVVALWPGAVRDTLGIREAAGLLDQRFRAMHAVTEHREREWRTFAGRVAKWEPVPKTHLRGTGTRWSLGHVWRSGDFWRAGTPPSLHCNTHRDLVFDRTRVWSWNVWYWRPEPRRKGDGVHVALSDERWSVHPGIPAPDHARCLRVVPGSVRLRPRKRGRAISEWLRDAPETINRSAVHAWLWEAWLWEELCTDTVDSRSFVELELGRLLLRDDGWIDPVELAYLREHARRRS